MLRRGCLAFVSVLMLIGGVNASEGAGYWVMTHDLGRLVFLRESSPPPSGQFADKTHAELLRVYGYFHAQGDSPFVAMLKKDGSPAPVSGQWPDGVDPSDKEHLIIWTVGSDRGYLVPAPYSRLLSAVNAPHDQVASQLLDVMKTEGPQAKMMNLVLPLLIKYLGYLRKDANSAVPALIDATKNKGFAVRMSAAAALGWIGSKDPAAAEALRTLSKDEEKWVRQNAELALKAIEKVE